MHALEENGKESDNKREKKDRKAPHTFVILLGVLFILAIASYFIPSGEYERTLIDGREVIVQGTYEKTENTSASFIDVFSSIYKGMTQSGEIVFFLLLIGGSLGVLSATGSVEKFLNQITTKFSGKEIYLVPILLAFFAVSGATFGMSEESIPYLIILLPILLKIGFDPLLIVALPLMGTAIGWAGSFTNPFNVGVAQQIAEVPLFSGMLVRVILFVIIFIITTIYLMNYAKKILKDPSRSLVYDVKNKAEAPITATDVEDGKQTLAINDIVILVVFAITIIAVPIGIITLGWFFTEMSALFIIMAIVVGIIARLDYNEIANAFAKGCNDLMVAALAVGFAYSGITILQDSNAIDPIVYGVTNVVGHLPSEFAAFGMFVAQSFMNFIVTSGSGQAALTMPIMTPLADTLDVSRQTAVLAYQFGDGVSNEFTPTSGSMWAALAIVGVPYLRWFRFYLPLLLMLYIVGGIYILIVHMFIWPV